MVDDNLPAPIQYRGVMVSSTFKDLTEHRAALIKAIKGQSLTDVAMENASPSPGLDVIDSSLQMVRDGTAYIGVISRKYGQTPKCPERNPRNVSITELEFNEAQRLNRPILLFIMGERHQVLEADVETNTAKRKKLEAFRERAKKMGPDSSVHRVYATFNSLDEFKEQSSQAVASLRRYLDAQAAAPTQQPHEPDKTKPDPIPTPPDFYAEPRYIGSHEFLGRRAQLDTLNDWSTPADSHPILLFEAIGGAGKSLLTWEWTTKHATEVRGDWAGRFWYSFYEKGAIMADFCQRALAYITGQPLKDFRKKKTAELSELLLHHLQSRPWLLILDGLERVLVAYHRFDAAQVTDEEAGTSDQIAQRDPCAAIRPEDDDLLRALAAAAPSKLLITSRLIPRVLLNSASQPIPGVLHERLPGLRPADAEALLRACGVTGTSRDIQSYLKSHCDCHPLVTGVLAGLINDYLPDRGNFDAWAADSAGGGQLNLANLNLVQKRNHILLAALGALPEKSRQLLSTLALLSEAVDFATLSALNPHRSGAPEKVEEPQRPEDEVWWGELSDDQKGEELEYYQESLQDWREYEQAFEAWQQELSSASPELIKTVRDLERRGLLQYDHQSKRHDLHPVVRGVAAGGLRQEDKERYGQRVVDHFSSQTHIPYEEAETPEDVRYGLHVVRTLLQMGHYERACAAYLGQLCNPLLFNLEANAEVLSVERPFFPRGWGTLPDSVPERHVTHLAGDAAIALRAVGEFKEALAAYGAIIPHCLRRKKWSILPDKLRGVAGVLGDMNRLAKEERLRLLSLELASLQREEVSLFMARLGRFAQLSRLGRFEEAESVWRLLDSMGRDWHRSSYRPGSAENIYARFCFRQGTLKEEYLNHAGRIAKAGRNRGAVRDLHSLRGQWRLEQCQWALAAESLHEAVRMAREIGQPDLSAEAMLCLAKFHLEQLPAARDEAEQLAKAKEPPDLALAKLWLAIGDPSQAKRHALAAYKSAWADGEPYVYRYELNQARALLEQLGAEIPNLPPYDPAADEKLPWEDGLTTAIEKLRAELEPGKPAGRLT